MTEDFRMDGVKRYSIDWHVEQIYPCGEGWLVKANDFDDALAREAALREELASERNRFMTTVDKLATQLAAVEQRNVGLKGLLLDITLDDDFPPHWNEAYAIDAALVGLASITDWQRILE